MNKELWSDAYRQTFYFGCTKATKKDSLKTGVEDSAIKKQLVSFFPRLTNVRTRTLTGVFSLPTNDKENHETSIKKLQGPKS